MVTINDYKLLLKEEVVGFNARKEYSHVEDNHNAHNRNDPTDEQDLSTTENRRPSKRSLDNTVEPSGSDQPAVSVLSQHVAKKTKVVVHKPTRKPSIAGCVVSKRKFKADDENPSQTATAPKSKSSAKKMKAQQTLGDISNKLDAQPPNKSKKTIIKDTQPQTAVNRPATTNDSKKSIKVTIVNNNKDQVKKLPYIHRCIAAFRARVRLTMPIINEGKAFSGFENESTICREEGRLYVLNKRQRWIKRGAGTLLLDKNGEEARLLMLNETTDVRVMLNLRLFFGMKAFIMEERSICFNLFDTMKDIYGKAEVKLVNYAIKVDDAKTAQQICKHINTSIPLSPCCVPKTTIDGFISKDIAAIIDQLMPKKQWEF